MQYILTAGWDDGVADLTVRLVRELAKGKKVLWLTSGGSNIMTSVQIIDNISTKLTRNLGVLLADERYGPVGHSQSNWAQLMDAGFKAHRAELIPVLKRGLSFTQTEEHYNKLVKQSFEKYDVIIAQLGIGQDGHLAGIMANSPAAKEAEALVVGYAAPPHQRLTLTFPALLKVTAAYTFAFGNTKEKALKDLRGKSWPPRRQPCQILKQISESYLYSDQVGDHT